MAKSQRTARTTVNESEYGSGEGEAAAVDAWEQQLAFDDGEETQQPAPTRGKAQPAEEDDDLDQQPDSEWDDDDWASEEEPEDDTDEDGEGDDEDDDADSDEEDDDSEDDDEDAPEPVELDPKAKVKVKVDGEDTEVTVQELKDGYSRTQDYTRKTQALADEREALEAKQQESAQEIAKKTQEWDQYLDQMGNAINALLGQRTPEDWAKLEREDRYTYLEERQKERTLQERLAAVEAEKQRTQQEQQEKYQGEFKKVVQSETEALYKALPDWKDNPDVAKREKSKMLQYAKSLGYTEQEVNSIVDHRAVLALRDAARLHALSAGKGKPAKSDKVRTRSVGQLKAGSPQRKSAKSSKLRKSSQNLAKSKTSDAAADYFETLLDSED